MYRRGMGAMGPFAVCDETGASCTPVANLSVNPLYSPDNILAAETSDLAAGYQAPSMFDPQGSPTIAQNWYWIAGIGAGVLALVFLLPARGRR